MDQEAFGRVLPCVYVMTGVCQQLGSISHGCKMRHVVPCVSSFRCTTMDAAQHHQAHSRQRCDPKTALLLSLQQQILQRWDAMHITVNCMVRTPGKPFLSATFCCRASLRAGRPSAGPYPLIEASPAARSSPATCMAAGGGCQCTMPCARDMTCLLAGAFAISCFVLTMTGGSVTSTRCETWSFTRQGEQHERWKAERVRHLLLGPG